MTDEEKIECQKWRDWYRLKEELADLQSRLSDLISRLKERLK